MALLFLLCHYADENAVHQDEGSGLFFFLFVLMGQNMRDDFYKA